MLYWHEPGLSTCLAVANFGSQPGDLDSSDRKEKKESTWIHFRVVRKHICGSFVHKVALQVPNGVFVR